jgi:hypothetical protein
VVESGEPFVILNNGLFEYTRAPVTPGVMYKWRVRNAYSDLIWGPYSPYRLFYDRPPSVYITGPLQISHYQSAQYFANVSGGAPPLHYQWQSRHCSGGICGAWSGWTAIGGPYDRSDTWASTTTCSVNVIELMVKVTDALLGTAQNQIGINVSPGGGPCG